MKCNHPCTECKVHEFLKVTDGKEPMKREESRGLPSWFPNKYSGYIPDYQSGFNGPVVSYYKRVDDKW